MGSSVHTFYPIKGGHTCLKQEGAHNVVDGTNDALSLTVLRRSIGARHAQVCTMGEEERAGAGVIELPTIVALDGLHCGAKLGANIREKVSQSSEGVKFEAQSKHP